MTDPMNSTAPPHAEALARELHLNGVHTKCPPDCLARWDAAGNDVVPGYSPFLPAAPAAPPVRRNRRSLFIVGGVVALVAIGVGVNALAGDTERPMTIKFTLFDVDGGIHCDSGGTGGYSDIGPGQPVTVKDETGKILASTTLPDTGEEADGLGCTWTMHVLVPEDAAQYGVEVGRRGTVTFEHDKLAKDKWVAETGIS